MMIVVPRVLVAGWSESMKLTDPWRRVGGAGRGTVAGTNGSDVTHAPMLPTRSTPRTRYVYVPPLVTVRAT